MPKFRVWYHRNPEFRENPDIYWKDIPRTHSLVKAVEAENLEEVFRMMQAEVWSPKGQARELIKRLGLCHTSMSVGDVIENLEDGAMYQVLNVGFERF